MGKNYIGTKTMPHFQYNFQHNWLVSFNRSVPGNQKPAWSLFDRIYERGSHLRFLRLSSWIYCTKQSEYAKQFCNMEFHSFHLRHMLSIYFRIVFGLDICGFHNSLPRNHLLPPSSDFCPWKSNMVVQVRTNRRCRRNLAKTENRPTNLTNHILPADSIALNL